MSEAGFFSGYDRRRIATEVKSTDFRWGYCFNCLSLHIEIRALFSIACRFAKFKHVDSHFLYLLAVISFISWPVFVQLSLPVPLGLFSYALACD